MKWGSASFFPVIDFINVPYNPTNTQDMLYGYPNLDMLAYIGYFLSVDVLSFFKSNDPLSILDLLLIVRITARF